MLESSNRIIPRSELHCVNSVSFLFFLLQNIFNKFATNILTIFYQVVQYRIYFEEIVAFTRHKFWVLTVNSRPLYWSLSLIFQQTTRYLSLTKPSLTRFRQLNQSSSRDTVYIWSNVSLEESTTCSRVGGAVLSCAMLHTCSTKLTVHRRCYSDGLRIGRLLFRLFPFRVMM